LTLVWSTQAAARAALARKLQQEAEEKDEREYQERMRKLKRDKENKERAARGEPPLPDDDAPSAPPDNALAAAGGKAGRSEAAGEGASSSSSKAAGLGAVPGQVPLFKSGGGGGGDAARMGSVGAEMVPVAVRAQAAQQVALSKVNGPGGLAPQFKGSSRSVAPGAEVGAGARARESLTLGQLAQKGLKVDVSITEPKRSAEEARKAGVEGQRMLRELETKAASHGGYQKMVAQRARLPAYEMEKEIVQAVRKHQVIVISGDTGCGKTTQLPQLILDDLIRQGRGGEVDMICTQPRRISGMPVSVGLF